MSDNVSRRSKFYSLASRAVPFSHSDRRQTHQPLESVSSDSPRDTRTSIDNPFSSIHSQRNPFNDEMDPGEDFLPQRPFAQEEGGSSRRSSFSSDRKVGSRTGSPAPRPASLSINYVPAKFTKLHAPGDWNKRRVNKVGGGRDAFAKNAQRMGMMGTVDDDEGITFQYGKDGLKTKKPKLRWNRFKWILFAANSILISYGIATLVCAILVWLNIFPASDVIRVGNRTELILSTIAASLITFTALLGFSGIMLNNRTFLAVYTLLLWPCFAFMVAPGYISYKQKTFNLEGKINLQWSRHLGTEGRLRIQNALRCCGYFSPFIEATQSPLCYSRSIQPGCKSRYLHLERHVLTTWFTVSFALVPAHILIIIIALLCSNHITYRFGKGLTPKRYRLDLDSMALIMDNYANEIAGKYGPEVANVAMSRSSSHLDVNEQGGSPRNSFSLPNSRQGSSTNLAAIPRQNQHSDRLAPPVSNSGALSQSMSRGNSAPSGSNNPNISGGVPLGMTRSNNSGSTLPAGYRQPSSLTRPPINSTYGTDEEYSYSDGHYDQNRESFDAGRPRSYSMNQPDFSRRPNSGQYDDAR